MPSPLLPAFVQRLLAKRREARSQSKQLRKLQEWEAAGKAGPAPHLVKQRNVKRHCEQYGLKILVESGTYRGDMVAAMKAVFRKIYTIELNDTLFRKACERFQPDTNVEVIHGDSGSVMGKLMPRIDQPALFWLDGHFSADDTAKGEKDTPIFEELTHILAAPDLRHVVLIDDARCFGTDPAYPTVEALQSFVLARRPNVRFTVDDDCIQIVPV